mgnify:CR=1 FL=1
MTHSNSGAAPLLVENLSLIRDLAPGPDALDLASGNGRNGRLLLEQGMFVTFADRDPEVLTQLREATCEQADLVSLWTVDLEQGQPNPLAGRSFDVVLVFNYLHRPLLPALRESVRPGGLIFYETFTTAQRAYGRPKNPDFLLRPGELRQAFAGWRILQDFEGTLSNPDRAVASLIAHRKPAHG